MTTAPRYELRSTSLRSALAAIDARPHSQLHPQHHLLGITRSDALALATVSIPLTEMKLNDQEHYHILHGLIHHNRSAVSREIQQARHHVIHPDAPGGKYYLDNSRGLGGRLGLGLGSVAFFGVPILTATGIIPLPLVISLIIAAVLLVVIPITGAQVAGALASLGHQRAIENYRTPVERADEILDHTVNVIEVNTDYDAGKAVLALQEMLVDLHEHIDGDPDLAIYQAELSRLWSQYEELIEALKVFARTRDDTIAEEEDEFTRTFTERIAAAAQELLNVTTNYRQIEPEVIEEISHIDSEAIRRNLSSRWLIDPTPDHLEE